MTDRDVAYTLYADGIPQSEIARYFGKSEQTICKWKKEDRWEEREAHEGLTLRTIQDDARELLSYQLRTLKELKKRYEEDARANNEPPKLIGKGDIDAIRDLFNVTKQKEIEWGVYVRVIREINKHLSRENLSLAQEIAPLLDKFILKKRSDL